MDLGKVRYFLKAAELENFSLAAEQCDISQATMSKYIAGLESEVGFALFTREQRKAYLTPDGDKLYRGLREIFEHYEELLSDIKNTATKELKIGISAQEYYEIPYLRDYQDKRFEIDGGHFQFYFGSMQKMEQKLKNHGVDLVIYPEGLCGSLEFEHRNFSEERLVMICSEETMQRYGSIREVIHRSTYITKSTYDVYLNKIKKLCKDVYGQEINKILHVELLVDQMIRVGMGEGYALIPIEAIRGNQRLHVESLDPIFSANMYLEYRKDDTNHLLQDFVNFIDVNR